MNVNTKPVRLLDMSPVEFKNFMESFDHVFSDCDGVIWTTETLPHVGEFFEIMQKHGKTVHFVSNSSIRTREDYQYRFSAAGIENGFEKLTIPSRAIAEYLKELHFNKAIYCVTCPETIRMLEFYGHKCTSGPHIASECNEEFLQYIQDDPDIGAVVFDLDLRGNLAKLNKAITYLKSPDVLFLCGATDRLIYFTEGKHALGGSVFTDIVAMESGRIPVILSKPSRDYGQFAMKRAGVTDPKRVLFIGDMIEQDVGLGKATGFKTLIILTNISKEMMMKQETIKPDYYAESLGSIVPLLNDYNR